MRANAMLRQVTVDLQSLRAMKQAIQASLLFPLRFRP
jgi:hypothetical protein